MLQSPLETYQQVEKVTGSNREIEAAVLTKAAMKLKACQKNWDAEDRDDRLDEALKFNQKVWSIFQSELKNKNHPMSAELRWSLLRLGGFVDRRIFETMANPSPEKTGYGHQNKLQSGRRPERLYAPARVTPGTHPMDLPYGIR